MVNNFQKNILSFIERSKLHHVVFWALYHLVWWTIYTGTISDVFQSLSEPHNQIKYLGYVVIQALGVYTCLYFLIPMYFENRKYKLFFISVLLIILFMAGFITVNYFFAAYLTKASVYEIFNIWPNTPITIFKKNALPSCISAMTLGMSIKLAKKWIEAQKFQEKLQKEKLETELKFLKSQFNPHFLFNTINSIFVLIDKNTDMASESLIKFSTLLRYQLYECNDNTIPLQNELMYIESFIELECLRQNDDFELELDIAKVKDDSLFVAPFILIPLIENAFKHLSFDKELKKRISLKVSFDNGLLNLELSNSADFEIKVNNYLGENNYGGLGLRNVRRRLDLLYPNSHSLVITKSSDYYTVRLQLDLLRDKKNVKLNRKFI